MYKVIYDLVITYSLFANNLSKYRHLCDSAVALKTSRDAKPRKLHGVAFKILNGLKYISLSHKYN